MIKTNYSNGLQRNEVDYFGKYLKYEMNVRRFISMSLLQYLIEQKQATCCNDLAFKFNLAMSLETEGDSKYWNKIRHGMVLSSRHKAWAIGKFQTGAMEFLCHPICQILSLPIKYFLPSPLNIFLIKERAKLTKAKTYIEVNDYITSHSKSSKYITTLNKLCTSISESYDASASFDFNKVRKLERKINKYIMDAQNVVVNKIRTPI